jgi:copper transport protein
VALMTVLRWGLYLALVLLAGSATVAAWIAPRATAPAAVHRSRTLAFGAALAVLLALAGLFVAQLLAFRDPFVPWSDDASVLLSTDWGRAWLGAVVIAGITAVAWGLGRRPGGRVGGRIGRAVGLVGAVALAFFPAMVGHAAAVGSTAVVADGVHVLGAGVWLGSLAAILAVARGPARGDLPGLIRAFSPLALAGGGVVLLTGGYAVWLHIPSPAALVESGYGRRLLVKLGLVAAVGALGAFHWRRWARKLDRWAGRGDGPSPGRDAAGGEAGSAPPGLPTASRSRIAPGRRTAGLEVVLAATVLLATAWLVGTSPP